MKLIKYVEEFIKGPKRSISLNEIGTSDPNYVTYTFKIHGYAPPKANTLFTDPWRKNLKFFRKDCKKLGKILLDLGFEYLFNENYSFNENSTSPYNNWFGNPDINFIGGNLRGTFNKPHNKGEIKFTVSKSSHKTKEVKEKIKSLDLSSINF
ncbi:MAG: hypothetical protein JSV39_03035 [Candidatus Aenigmatarchaeota archaeon]|nr:MAG: hypothetical protein JSV39_03035 [Candidatus Aenigmarchaeota archaeon]